MSGETSATKPVTRTFDGEEYTCSAKKLTAENLVMDENDGN